MVGEKANVVPGIVGHSLTAVGTKLYVIGGKEKSILDVASTFFYNAKFLRDAGGAGGAGGPTAASLLVNIVKVRHSSFCHDGVSKHFS